MLHLTCTTGLSNIWGDLDRHDSSGVDVHIRLPAANKCLAGFLAYSHSIRLNWLMACLKINHELMGKMAGVILKSFYTTWLLMERNERLKVLSLALHGYTLFCNKTRVILQALLD